MIMVSIKISNGAPANSLFNLNNFDEKGDDFIEEEFYDQRQNGTENFRIKIDGLIILVPDDIISEQPNKPQLNFNQLLLNSNQVSRNKKYFTFFMYKFYKF